MGKWVLEQEMWGMWHEICTLTPLAPTLHLSFVGKHDIDLAAYAGEFKGHELDLFSKVVLLGSNIARGLWSLGIHLKSV